MYKYTLFIFVLCAYLFSEYSVGDTISTDYQNREFDYCYPSDSTSTFSLSKYLGKIIMIEMTASWWSECYAHLQDGDDLINYWKEQDNRVSILHLFDDPFQPHSCQQWGDAGDVDIPPIIEGGYDADMFQWFEGFVRYSRPYYVFINHEMVITDIIKEQPCPIECANERIHEMLLNMPTMSISENDEIFTIDKFHIIQLYPNPFNPVLQINFDILLAGIIHVNIMDITGNHLETLHSGYFQSGSHKLSWDAESMPSGVYLVSLKSDYKTLTEKVVLLK